MRTEKNIGRQRPLNLSSTGESFRLLFVMLLALAPIVVLAGHYEVTYSGGGPRDRVELLGRSRTRTEHCLIPAGAAQVSPRTISHPHSAAQSALARLAAAGKSPRRSLGRLHTSGILNFRQR